MWFDFIQLQFSRVILSTGVVNVCSVHKSHPAAVAEALGSCGVWH